MTRQIWYLAHPVAADDSYTYEQNLAHALHMVKLFYEEGWRVIAPWHTLCLVMPDAVPEYRKIGLEVDCITAACLGRIVLVGHKISNGMKQEMDAVEAVKGMVIDLTNAPDRNVRNFLQSVRT